MGLLKSSFRCSISLSSVELPIYLLLLSFSLTFGNEQKVIRNSETDYSHAELVKSYMNSSVAPCDDFYEYACGNFENIRPDRYSRRENLGKPGYVLDDIAKELLHRMDLAESLNVSRELRVAQRFYNACLEADLHPFPAADSHYLNIIRSIGGFPAVDGAAWNASNFSWFNMSAHLTNYGARGIYSEVLPNNGRSEVSFEVNYLGFDAPVQLDNMKKQNKNKSWAYKRNEQRMRRYLRSFNLTEAKIAEVIDGVFVFWREALEEEYAIRYGVPFDVTNYFEIIWNQSEKRGSFNSDLQIRDRVCIRHPEAVANYLAMQLLYTFDSSLKDIKNQRDYCTTKMRTSMWPLFKKLHLAENFDKEKRSEVLNIVQEVRKSLQTLVEEVTWLDSEARKKALFQVSATEFHFGTPADSSLTDQLVREILRLEVVDDSYAVTNMNLLRLQVDIQRFRIRHPREDVNNTKPWKAIFGFDKNITNDNAIVEIDAGLLEPPYYHRSWPHSLKFGSLGFTLGEHLTTFLLFSSFEKMDLIYKDCQWKTFSKHLGPKVFQQLYLYTDSGGLRSAFEAYRSRRMQTLEDPEQKMPGLDLLPDQLFFLGFAQTVCYDLRAANWSRQPKYKLLSDLSNSEDFLQAFNCPVGSGMRPTNQTCQVW
ncbi:neprilysin-2-like [Drosophila takahashii]|uniref:neprilysin-2-like n=1 Tax=Drosophila takahashii TaxID=29030 RepID=UPI003898E551